MKTTTVSREMLLKLAAPLTALAIIAACGAASRIETLPSDRPVPDLSAPTSAPAPTNAPDLVPAAAPNAEPAVAPAVAPLPGVVPMPLRTAAPRDVTTPTTIQRPPASRSDDPCSQGGKPGPLCPVP